tara:strand:+ start:1915 stop:2442 length:528 start_codon:yes stop_codon:yes gene_type:complete
MIDPKKIYTAHYMDNEQKTLEVMLGTDEPGVYESMIIPYDPTLDNCKAVLGVINDDQLMENTYTKRKSEHQAMIDLAVSVAKGEGVDLDPVLLESDSGYWPKFVSALFTDIENEDHLFALKLALFENENVRSSEDSDLKAELRQGKTKTEVLMAALQIVSGKKPVKKKKKKKVSK